MLDDIFCSKLEYKICEVFRNMSDIDLKGFWCDGIILPDSDAISLDGIIAKKQISGQAFIGKDGQTKYDLTLEFGEKTLNFVTNGQISTDYLPIKTYQEWFDIDVNNKKIIIKFD